MAQTSTIESSPPGAIAQPLPGASPARSSRFETWEQDLATFLEEAAHKPFAWGSHDCCLFVSEAIGVMTGTDIAEIKHLPGNYHTRIGAYALLGKTMDARTFREALEHLAEEFGFPVWSHPALAQRGDAALVQDERGEEALGIVDLDGRWVVCLGENGLIRLPADGILIAWKI